MFWLAALALAAPAAARAAGNPGHKLDPALAGQLDAPGAAARPVHLLVFGPGLALLNVEQHLAPRHRLVEQSAESLTVPASEVAAIAASPLVSYVAPDRPLVPTVAQPAPAALQPVSADRLETLYPRIDGADAAWATGDTGAGIGIAVVDSGVTPRADFGDRLVQVTLPAQDGTQLSDSVGHGSAVAGVAAGDSPDGAFVGVAPGATVYAVNVAHDDGVYSSDVVAGLLWVLHHARQGNIRVVNLSLQELAPSDPARSALDATVELLWRAGIVVVCSAGNRGPQSELYAPANDPYALTVGASDSGDTLDRGDDALAAFSSYGPTLQGVAKPEIVAPGRHIATTIPPDSSLAAEAPATAVVDEPGGYVRISGTSFSAPQVAGAAALLLQAHPELTPDQVKWTLVQGERPLAGSDAGALDVGLAEALAESPGSANAGLTPALPAVDGEAAIFARSSDWDGSSWDGSSWDASNWDASSWDASSWDASSWD